MRARWAVFIIIFYIIIFVVICCDAAALLRPVLRAVLSLRWQVKKKGEQARQHWQKRRDPSGKCKAIPITNRVICSISISCNSWTVQHSLDSTFFYICNGLDNPLYRIYIFVNYSFNFIFLCLFWLCV